MKELTVIGGGLAGTEAAWQAAELGVPVRLYEMRPGTPTPAHDTPWLAELVCSNSLGSELPHKAPGLLKAELRGLGSVSYTHLDVYKRQPYGSRRCGGRTGGGRPATSGSGSVHPGR